MLLLSSLPSLPSIPVAHLQPPPTIAATGVVSTRRTLLLPLLPPLHPLSVAHSSSDRPPWRPLALCQPVVRRCCCLRCTDSRSVAHLQPPTTVTGATAGAMGATHEIHVTSALDWSFATCLGHPATRDRLKSFHGNVEYDTRQSACQF